MLKSVAYPYITINGKDFLVRNFGLRFGFNGQEADDEIFAGAYTAEYWEYDSRLGRRWNCDPVVFASISVYAVLNNNPISFVDLLGLEAIDNEKPKKEYTSPNGQVFSSDKLKDIKGNASLFQNTENGKFIKFNEKTGKYEYAKFRNFLSKVMQGVMNFFSKIKNIWMNREGFAIGGGETSDHAKEAFFKGGKPTRVIPTEAIIARTAGMSLGLGQYKPEKPGDAEVINSSIEAKEATEKAESEAHDITKIVDLNKEGNLFTRTIMPNGDTSFETTYSSGAHWYVTNGDTYRSKLKEVKK